MEIEGAFRSAVAIRPMAAKSHYYMLSIAKTRRRYRNALLRWLLPPPVKTDHFEYSGVSFIGPEEEAPKELVLLALRAAERAIATDLSELSLRIREGLLYPDLWPGQHYKLLAAFTSILQPAIAIEIGTFSGLSALAIQHSLPPGGKLSTFDVIPWNQISETLLRDEDFASGNLEQIVADLSRKEIAWSHADLLRSADFVFVDAAKDGVMEWSLLRHFHDIRLKRGAIIFFDDIRLWNMLAVWKSISYPKLDVTSFGHYTGSGIVLIDS